MSANNKLWEHFEHGADVGIRGQGRSLEEAFIMGAQALTAVVVPPSEVKAIEFLDIRCNAPDIELLFFDWINAVIFEMDTRRMVFSSFEIKINGNSLTGKIGGEPLSSLHAVTVEPKGATMTELKVQNKNDLWIAQCIVDV